MSDTLGEDMLDYSDKIKNTEILSLIEQFSNKGYSLPIFSSLKNNKYVIMPGFCDVHVHLREPGFSYKETIKTGTLAAAHGGYTTVFSMANLNPVPDSVESLKVQLDIIKKDAVIEVKPYGAITVGEMGKALSDLDGMSKDVIAFSDDGRGVQDEKMMKRAMLKAKSLDKAIVAHCEDNSLLFNGYIHDGEYAKNNGHRGICSASEYKQIERDLELGKQTGVKYHICHVSAKESVQAIRKAKREGVNVSAETAPHYLILTDADLKEDGKFKMNPPLRSLDDKTALIEGVLDGTLDMIATDHAPHSKEEKERGLEKSPFGIVGIETSFALLYTHLVKKGILSLENLVNLLAINPRKRFNLPIRKNDFTVFELNNEYEIKEQDLLSKGKATPFINQKVYGKCMLTVYNGNVVYKDQSI